ncbi:MAG: hypothetical protein AAFO02_16305 [Bacteroidota bacterium]
MRQALKKLISDNHTHQAIDELEQITKGLPGTSFYNSVILITGEHRWNKEHQQRRTRDNKELS